MTQPGQTGRIFVGRDREMAQLTAALDSVIAGKGRLVLLAGEPGIGKTRTAQELAQYALARGAQVSWGRCYEEEGTPPYWPWVQLIRTFVERMEPEQLQAAMGVGAADIGAIVPDIFLALPNLEPSPALEPEAARFRLFDSITRFFKNAGRSQPLVLVLDDIHWADEPSLQLLQFLAREIEDSNLMVVGCYRDVELSRQHPLSQTLAQLSRESVYQRHLLRGLDREATSEYIEAAAGTDVSQEVLEAVYTHTEGNPFFTTEVIQLLSDRGELSGESVGGPDGIRIPEGVREVIGQRLNGLSEECNRELTKCAVLGSEFGVDALVRISPEINQDQALELMEEALAMRLIEEVPQQLGRYRFTHALIQETLAGELSLTRQVRLHATIAQELEQMYGVDAEEHAAELAHHFAMAEAAVGPEKLVHYSLVAGERSLAAYAYEEALTFFQQGLSAKGEQELDAQGAALLFGLGQAQLALWVRTKLSEAVGNLDQAFDYYAESGDTERALAIAEHQTHSVVGRNTGSINRVTLALTMVPSNSVMSGRLLAIRGSILGQEFGDYEGADADFSQALAIAQNEDDAALELRILGGAAYMDFYHSKWRECLKKVPRALELLKTVDDPISELFLRFGAALAELATGHADAARLHLAEGMNVAERLRDRFFLCGMFFRQSLAFHLTGEWQIVRESTDHGLALLPMDPRVVCCRILLEYEVGDFDQGDIYLERSLESMRLAESDPTLEYGYLAAVVPLSGQIRGGDPGHQDTTLDAATYASDLVLSSPFTSPVSAYFVHTGLAFTAAQQRDGAAAREQYSALKPIQGTMMLQVSVDRMLGLLAQTFGDLDLAGSHFNDSLDFCRKAGYRPELAWTCCDYAGMLVETGGKENQERATALLEEGLAISTELGMKPLMSRITGLQEQAGSEPADSPNYPNGLTGREVGVLRLISGGKTNREIADELFISVKTVNNHVTNILTKTNSANRAEAATYAAAHGITATPGTDSS
ncbi:MAG: AAA family ATPase [Chloroflexi bacterium]|nr:AAA family ATPase [Chloroflexota bacterium]